jgi:hypothetical protein
VLVEVLGIVDHRHDGQVPVVAIEVFRHRAVRAARHAVAPDESLLHASS